MKKYIIGILVFAFFFSVGILLARHKPLWGDELYGLQVTVMRTSWPDLILGHSKEWNSYPLYHVLQKGFLQILHYHLPFVWDGAGLVLNPEAQCVIRILPDLFMSMALTVIVLFFGIRSGWAGGVVSAVLCLSVPMVWMFWVEARPYSLWFMLSVFQGLLFLDKASKKEACTRFTPFVLVHAGLCLCSPLGILQTLICMGLLWCFGTRRITFFIMAGLLPLFLGGYYFIAQQKMSMYLFVSWQEILFRNFPMEEVFFLGLYVLFLLLSLGDAALRKYFVLGCAFLPFCLALISVALAGLYYTANHNGPQTAPVVERHFIFLVPLGIIMASAFFSDLWAARGWWRLGVAVIFALGLIAQGLSTFTMVYHSTVYY